MNPNDEKQDPPIDRFQLFGRIKALGINNLYLAKKLNRTPAAISYALGGESDVLLRRIDRHVTYLERQRQGKQIPQAPVAQL